MLNEKNILRETLIGMFKAVNNEKKDENVVIDTYAIAHYYGINQRTVRQVLSELRKELIIFIPYKSGKGHYLLYNENKKEHRELLGSYVRTQTRSIRTEYFNDIVSLKAVLKDNILLDEINQMQLALKG